MTRPIRRPLPASSTSGLRRRGWPLFRPGSEATVRPACDRRRRRPLPAAMTEMQKLLNSLIGKHTRSPADWRLAMAQGREGEPAYGDIIQAAIGDRAALRYAFRAPAYLAYVVLN